VLGKVARGRLCCMAGRTLTKFLGPIGIAWTVGEIGAFAIEKGGDIYAAQLERDFACAKLSKVVALRASACGRAQKTKDAFSLKFKGCTILSDLSFDLCGPVGIKEFKLNGAGCEAPLACGADEIAAATLFDEAALDTLECANAIRVAMAYESLCYFGRYCRATPTS